MRALLLFSCAAFMGCGGCGGADDSIVTDSAVTEEEPPPTVDATQDEARYIDCTVQLVDLVQTGPQPDAIQFDETFVYWHDARGIFRMPKTGGNVDVIIKTDPISWPNVAFFIVDNNMYDDDLYFDHSGVPAFVPKIGIPITQLPTTIDVGRFALGLNFVYFWSRGAASTTIESVDATSTFTVVTPVVDMSPPHRMLVDTTLGDNDTDATTAFAATDTGLYEIALPTGPATSMDARAAWSLAFDDGNVYFTSIDVNGDAGGSSIFAVDRTTLSETPIAATTNAVELASNATDIYFTDTTSPRVRKLVGKTGPVVDIATITDGAIPVGVAQDGLCVYWTTAPQGGGTGALHAAPL